MEIIKQSVLLWTELEWILSETGAFKTELENDPRPKIRDALFSQLNCGNSRTQERNNDSDSDYW